MNGLGDTSLCILSELLTFIEKDSPSVFFGLFTMQIHLKQMNLCRFTGTILTHMNSGLHVFQNYVYFGVLRRVT